MYLLQINPLFCYVLKLKVFKIVYQMLVHLGLLANLCNVTIASSCWRWISFCSCEWIIVDFEWFCVFSGIWSLNYSIKIFEPFGFQDLLKNLWSIFFSCLHILVKFCFHYHFLTVVCNQAKWSIGIVYDQFTKRLSFFYWPNK